MFPFLRARAACKGRAVLTAAARQDARERAAARRRLLEAARTHWAAAQTQAIPPTGPLLTLSGEQRFRRP